ncbi:hypothetical protein BH11VER1_BH11VER1_15170 [soil metagenome]
MKYSSALLAWLLAIAAFFNNSTQASAAPSEAGENPAHLELRVFRDGLLAAINKGDNEATLPFLHPNVVITWLDGEVSRGHAGVRAYHERVMTGPGKIVESFTCTVNVDELSILYPGDMAVCFGSCDENFKLASGGDLRIKGRWTATLIKENGKWLLTSLHVSTNLFDNPMLALAKKSALYAAIASLVAGILVGWLIKRRRKPAP